MFKNFLFLISFAFFIMHHSKVYCAEKIDDQIISKFHDYNKHIDEILIKLKNKFCLLEDSKRREGIKQLFVQIRLKELEYSNKYQFVTAQDSRYFAFQVIAKELYEAINGKSSQDFEFLRYPFDNLIRSPEEFFMKYPFFKNKSNKMDPDYFDASPEISYQLLSASFSIDTYVAADSALFVFFYGKGISEWFNNKEEYLYQEKFTENISAIFDQTGIEKKIYQPYLRQLIYMAPKTNEGIINQIFLPIENIEDYLYIASSCGFLTSKNTDIHQTIAHFQKLRFDDFILKENMQVRLVVGSLFDENVHIYRYTLIPKDEQENYKNMVKMIIQKMLNR